jgi:hypothetical protein
MGLPSCSRLLLLVVVGVLLLYKGLLADAAAAGSGEYCEEGLEEVRAVTGPLPVGTNGLAAGVHAAGWELVVLPATVGAKWWW